MVFFSLLSYTTIFDAITSQSLLCEIRSGQTYRGSFTRNLRTVGRMPGLENATLNVVYRGEGAFVDEGVSVFGIREWLTR